MMRTMKKMTNEAIHMIGVGFVLFGALLVIKASGMCDLGGDLTALVRYAVAGMVSIIGGRFLAWWRV